MSQSKDIFKRVTDATKNTIQEQADTGRKLVSKAKNLADDVQKQIAESGAKEKVDQLQRYISGTLDEISGQAMYQLVQEWIAEQDRFNDLLATKLHEALERISQLEKQLAGK